jgi:hypothetical protein
MGLDWVCGVGVGADAVLSTPVALPAERVTVKWCADEVGAW